MLKLSDFPDCKFNIKVMTPCKPKVKKIKAKLVNSSGDGFEFEFENKEDALDFAEGQTPYEIEVTK